MLRGFFRRREDGGVRLMVKVVIWWDYGLSGLLSIGGRFGV